jgi:hypothetical protein
MMIIKDVQLSRTGQAAVLSARCKIRKIGWDTVDFSIANTALGAYVHDDASPFAAALLLPSMKQGEDLIIEGSISEQLYKGMHAVMHEVLNWNIGLQPIKIKADALVADTLQPRRTASFFSGGVDSFYTYLKHKTDLVQADRVDSFVLVNGFDIEPRNVPLWDSTLKNISAIAAAEKIELVVVQTNIQVLTDPILSWDYIHGGCLAAVGLFLRGAFRLVYIPSSFSLEEQVPWGSCLALDGHWSTENTTFVHDGIEATRIDKVIWEVAQSSLALEHLRVCYENVKGSYNCGRCDKCLRTMINLYIAGALERSKTFPHNIDLELVSAITALPINGTFPGENQNLRGLRERNLAPDLQKAIIASMNNAAAVTGKSLVADIKDRVKCLDHIYTRGYVYSAWERLFGSRFS